ncbi:TIGR00266 family protein [Cyanobacterium aponinum AL20118]|uniref:TIGR00266 family protein n=1 Tax=Cyanobacterium aponinum AL20115 TaxID=3090662 RepID=A0AAF0ZBD4_9CHRO|nr:TIGR00266 family protein [Cyanobacterium aponinum]MBD2392937.1 TIGR00266 family protein [Cyanobacterium aponinum FACHB-4101]PHV62268.1 TIGR00266 family protein [Cyanobacterium aponinum IPPAS B-1201]WPF87035.1 TIGR00266 family protein [Cyanobacterium aponinum AL20115]
MLNKSEIKYRIEHNPAYGFLVLELEPNQTAIVEAGGMAAMDSSIKMESKMKGGFGQSFGRMLGGESLFLNEFTAQGSQGELYISPGVPGDIQYYHLDGSKGLMIQSSGFVASSKNVEINSNFQGFKGFFSGESIFLLKATGKGDIWFSSYGAIVEIDVENNYVVDTGYIVAFEDTLNYNVEMIGGLSFRNLRTGILGGEGLVCRFSGSGKLWIQSRGLYPLLNFLYPFRPVKSSD